MDRPDALILKCQPHRKIPPGRLNFSREILDVDFQSADLKGEQNRVSLGLIVPRRRLNPSLFPGSNAVPRICSFPSMDPRMNVSPPLTRTSLHGGPNSKSGRHLKTVVVEFIVAKKIKSLYRSLASNWKKLTMNNNLAGLSSPE